MTAPYAKARIVHIGSSRSTTRRMPIYSKTPRAIKGLDARGPEALIASGAKQFGAAIGEILGRRVGKRREPELRSRLRRPFRRAHAVGCRISASIQPWAAVL